jgi:hypothetical protein
MPLSPTKRDAILMLGTDRVTSGGIGVGAAAMLVANCVQQFVRGSDAVEDPLGRQRTCADSVHCIIVLTAPAPDLERRATVFESTRSPAHRIDRFGGNDMELVSSAATAFRRPMEVADRLLPS